ncbi:protein methyltransferase [Eremomyces bilateralis CBS 781.70]|uniref:type I protein arginine methyltransferase n=1 Tax=Eremomyces bilateralis CBS 781.70 TaxID=1392243 RepID=A0A6G1G6G9_9PEZI|nr:protein methyltransferase [Eremomyces bilateralis CBS 781.70]KAF1813624.1 protein methyltransferase [Eremomyces bilateralis CBS 781.70]
MSSVSSDSESDILDPRADEGWEDVEPEEEIISVKSFFDDRWFPDVKSMLEYCKQEHGFDFSDVRKRLGLDFYDTIKLINYIREGAKVSKDVPEITSRDQFVDDKFLQPALEDDALLFSLSFDDGPDDAENQEPGPTGTDQELKKQIKELEEALNQKNQEFESYREAVSKSLDKRWGASAETEDAPVVPKISAADVNERQAGHDDSYFESYDDHNIHHTMLKDAIRTDAYRDFIYDNKHLFAGKTVLDIGCGTGILSMFCAKAGAARVIAVDNSSVLERARANVAENGLEKTITCIRGKIEEVKLPVEKVDIIVSEWMGYCLLFEAMLDSVLWARDRYLKSGGLMVPSHCTLQIAPAMDSDYFRDNVDFWRDVYGFKMSAMGEKMHDDALVCQLKEKNIAGKSYPFLVLPLHDITTKDLSFTREFNVTLEKKDAQLDAWVVWFDTFFLTSPDATLEPDARAENWKDPSRGTAFTTGPFGKETHWMSGVFWIDQTKTKTSDLKTGDTVSGTITYRQGKSNKRGLEVDISWSSPKEPKVSGTQAWLIR